MSHIAFMWLYCSEQGTRSLRWHGGHDVEVSIVLSQLRLLPLNNAHRHFWWNGGYFGCIFQVRSMLPKAEVSDSRVKANHYSHNLLSRTRHA